LRLIHRFSLSSLLPYSSWPIFILFVVRLFVKGETADFVLPGFFGYLLDFSGFGIPKIRRFPLAIWTKELWDYRIILGVFRGYLATKIRGIFCEPCILLCLRKKLNHKEVSNSPNFKLPRTRLVSQRSEAVQITDFRIPVT